MARTTLSLALISLSLACARGPTAAETLPKLRTAIDAEVASEAQNSENSALVDAVADRRHLEAMTRSELSDKLGPGEPCRLHPVCEERGFLPEDRYFEVGHQGAVYLRYRPALIVGFNRFGKVDRTFVLRVE
jgi:hypothetical protein